MGAAAIDGLVTLEGPGGTLALRRAWPRGPGHLLLEYAGAAGDIVPGQWIAERGERRRVAEETSRCARAQKPVLLDAAGVLLQPGGADRRLPGLADVLARPGASLVAHRPERRAVVRLSPAASAMGNGHGGERYARVLRPARLADSLAAARHLIESSTGFVLPKIFETDEPRGVVVWSALAGATLHELMGDAQRLVAAMHEAGAALRALHATPAPPGAPAHGARAEGDLLREQIVLLEALDPESYGRVAGALRPVLVALDGPPCGEVTLHRDLHDKQIVIDGRGRPGLLDFDTAARGEPALDVANMLAHLDLRLMQGRCALPAAQAASVSAAFVAGYGASPAVLGRIPVYRAAALLRLACVYSYRPAWRHLAPRLAELSVAALRLRTRAAQTG
jgi:aminoglycoside phosphotransferase (APT) family kinase protein